MDETFYGLLEVESDADVERIRTAYRAQVKEYHPDVSDDPEAPERFRRLTTARDVLVDEEKRARYDRVGHTSYVRNHLADSSWVETGNTDRSGAHSGAGRSRNHRAGNQADSKPTGQERRKAWLGDQWERDDTTGSHREDGGVGSGNNEGWQQATRAYRRSETTLQESPSLVWRFGRGIRQIGGWALIHAVFITSAVATAWFTYHQAASQVRLSVPTLLAGAVVLGTVVFLSILHVVSQLYT